MRIYNQYTTNVHVYSTPLLTSQSLTFYQRKHLWFSARLYYPVAAFYPVVAVSRDQPFLSCQLLRMSLSLTCDQRNHLSAISRCVSWL